MEAGHFPTRRKRDSGDSDFGSIDGGSKKRQKRQAPYIIFPEILCIVDYDGYRYVCQWEIVFFPNLLSFVNQWNDFT